jgi:hypothetical protein
MGSRLSLNNAAFFFSVLCLRYLSMFFLFFVLLRSRKLAFLILFLSSILRKREIRGEREGCVR